MATPPVQNSQSLNAIVLRALKVMSILILVWGGLAENTGWNFGIEAVLVATLATLLFIPLLPPRWNMGGLVLYLIYFLKQSLRGGVDVAYRAFHPRLPLDPGWIDYRLRLPTGKPRVMFLNSASLLPGTLSVDFDGDRATIHTLVRGPAVYRELHELEQRIALFFALNLATQEIENG